MRYHLFASICIASLVFVTSPTSAQERQYSSGLNYTTLGGTQKKDTESVGDKADNTDQKPAKPRVFNTIKPKNAEPTKETADEIAEETTDGPEEEEEAPAVTVWNKYKELAAGKAGEKEAKAEDTKTITPGKPDKPSVAKPSVPNAEQGEVETRPAKNAFGSIIDEWKSSRDKQREMRSRTFAVPESK